MTSPPDAGPTPAPVSARWGDLRPRLISGGVLALVGLAAVWAGGIVFAIFAALAVGVMIWELSRMHASDAPLLLGALAGICCLAVSIIPAGYGLPLVMVPVFASIGRIGRDRLVFGIYAALVVLAGYGLVKLRQDFGAVWLVWLVLVVAATDIFGYFAGRMIGGPKFWPRVSPKKTWSGTIAGWIAAAIVGAVFVVMTGAGASLISISIALSMAAQLGDISESVVKRRAGVKDSSNLIPGHGGFFDRFDGVLGASVFLLLIEQVVDFPGMATA